MGRSDPAYDFITLVPEFETFTKNLNLIVALKDNQGIIAACDLETDTKLRILQRSYKGSEVGDSNITTIIVPEGILAWEKS